MAKTSTKAVAQDAQRDQLRADLAQLEQYAENTGSASLRELAARIRKHTDTNDSEEEQ